jgi:hypothetical protein
MNPVLSPDDPRTALRRKAFGLAKLQKHSDLVPIPYPLPFATLHVEYSE